MSRNYYMQDPKQSDNIIRTSNPDYWKEYKQLPQKEGARLYREQAVADLRRRIKPGQKIYVKQTSVSRSGMSRRLELYIINKGDLERITHSASVVMDWPMNDDGLSVGGCGMDMHFHAVYTLSRCLFSEGFGVVAKHEGGAGYPKLKGKTKRALSEYDAERMTKNGWIFPYHNGARVGWMNDGGYALTKESI